MRKSMQGAATVSAVLMLAYGVAAADPLCQRD